MDIVTMALSIGLTFKIRRSGISSRRRNATVMPERGCVSLFEMTQQTLCGDLKGGEF